MAELLRNQLDRVYFGSNGHRGDGCRDGPAAGAVMELPVGAVWSQRYDAVWEPMIGAVTEPTADATTSRRAIASNHRATDVEERGA